jgi:hypothetical protein
MHASQSEAVIVPRSYGFPVLAPVQHDIAEGDSEKQRTGAYNSDMHHWQRARNSLTRVGQDHHPGQTTCAQESAENCEQGECSDTETHCKNAAMIAYKFFRWEGSVSNSILRLTPISRAIFLCDRLHLSCVFALRNEEVSKK